MTRNRQRLAWVAEGALYGLVAWLCLALPTPRIWPLLRRLARRAVECPTAPNGRHLFVFGWSAMTGRTPDRCAYCHAVKP